MPLLLTAVKELNKPRYPNMGGIVKAFREHEVKVWNAVDIGADPSKVGLEGSPTQVKRTFAPEPRGKVKIMEGGTTSEMVGNLVDHLKEKNVVR